MGQHTSAQSVAELILINTPPSFGFFLRKLYVCVLSRLARAEQSAANGRTCVRFAQFQAPTMNLIRRATDACCPLTSTTTTTTVRSTFLQIPWRVVFTLEVRTVSQSQQSFGPHHRMLGFAELPHDTRTDDISKLFEGFGPVKDVRVMTGVYSVAQYLLDAHFSARLWLRRV